MCAQKTNNQLTETQEGELLGKKLAVYIASMPIDDDAKQKMFEAVQLMTPAEAVEFCAELDALYADHATKEIDETQAIKIEKIKAKYDKKREKIVKSNVEALADFEKELDLLSSGQ
jgi:hypothetical protein